MMSSKQQTIETINVLLCNSSNVNQLQAEHRQSGDYSGMSKNLNFKSHAAGKH